MAKVLNAPGRKSEAAKVQEMAAIYLKKMNDSSEQMAKDQEKIDRLKDETRTVASQGKVIAQELQNRLAKLRAS